MPDTSGQIPIHALRDLLGLVRSIYAEWSSAGSGPIELEELRAIGENLNVALRLAMRTQPNTPGHRTAWARAEEAARDLGEFVKKHTALASTAQAASRRVLGSPAPKVLFDPHEKLRERYRRG
ncbi:MAG TPA: hypothetical protein VHV51_12715 [Polyangiaceae bacterium]|nr:hypothetical protein [Polyangiaceae bacterium]